MTRATTTTAFLLTPIRPEVADRLRAMPGAPVYVAEEHPRYPCRQCLRDAEVGEELVLVSHDPFTAESPYRSASPIFLHCEPCAPPSDVRTIPEQLTRRLLSARAFDRNTMMIDAEIMPGAELAATLERFFADETTDHVHVHNATRGCWAVRVDRAPS
jgi:Protein of unknown function (DUF1203)